MKTAKILLAASVACLLATTSLQAQGRINFANGSATPICIGAPFAGFGFVVLGTASTAAFGIGPASVQVSLMAGLTSSSLSPVLIGTAADQPFVLNTASMIAIAQGTFPGGNNLVLPGFDGSAPVFLQMHLLSVNLFAEGYSPIISVIPASGGDTATPVFSATANPNAWDPSDAWGGTFGGNLRIGIPIPEPSALALIGMSLPLMFLARRRRLG